jgi:hypothetical protein
MWSRSRLLKVNRAIKAPPFVQLQFSMNEEGRHVAKVIPPSHVFP